MFPYITDNKKVIFLFVFIGFYPFLDIVFLSGAQGERHEVVVWLPSCAFPFFLTFRNRVVREQ